jgi:hypothetical protein
VRFGPSALLLVVVLATSAARASREFVPVNLLLRVVDSATRRPLPNAEVSAGTRRGLTDVSGEVRILWPESGELRVRIRQLGFRYVDRTFRRDPASSAGEDTVVVALAPVGWALPQVVVRATRRCRDPGDPRRAALSEASMELLRFGAEQFENFRRAYPFEVAMERRTIVNAPGGRTPPRELVERDSSASNAWGDPYVPGKVVQRQSSSHYFIPLLFVSALADSAFWERHCFQARGVEWHEGRRLIRLDFFPALDVKEPEWAGAAWLDSAQSVLARVDFRLMNLGGSDGPDRFEGYTVFSTPTPYIAMPDSTVAWWSRQEGRGFSGEIRSSGGMQTLVMRDVRYRGRRPPEGNR